MTQRKQVHGGCAVRTSPCLSPLIPSDESKTPEFVARSFVSRSCCYFFLCLVFFVSVVKPSQAQVSEAESAIFADALSYCRGDVTRPLALRGDKRLLCLDGGVSNIGDILLASGLEQGGLFVVRSRGEDIALTIDLADLLLARQATVIVSDYCLSVCASFLFIASAKSFVPKDSLVAWTNYRTGSDICTKFSETSDPTAPRLERLPCAGPFRDSRAQSIFRRENQFHYGRVRPAQFQNPPQSVAIRRILKRKFDATGTYPDEVYWTWNPRYYASAIKTKVIYEAYPQNQDSVDAILKRIGLSLSIIHDP